MLEIETKFLEVDTEAVLADLARLQAEKLYDGLVQTRYYDTPERTIRSQEKSLRLRLKEVTGDVRLTSKHKRSADVVRICEEHEVAIGNGSTATGRARFEEMHMLLAAVNFAPYRRYEKRRVSYGIGDTRFELDTILSVDGKPVEIPTFLEVESSSPDAVVHYASLLGFSKEDAQPLSTRAVFKRYKRT
jgi:adenylate cyclase class IV